MAERRPRAATEEKRQRLLDATEEIMLADGYAAVSSRRVAAAVGINAPLVHYYFPTLDDLFVADADNHIFRKIHYTPVNRGTLTVVKASIPNQSAIFRRDLLRKYGLLQESMRY